MKIRLTALLAAAVLLSACDNFKEAMTAHVDVVARAGSQELSVDHLAKILGESKVPLNAEVARSVADLWVNYQLLAEAAAHNDSLKDPKAIDEAMWPYLAQMRAAKWHEQVQKTFSTGDTTNAEAKYNNGEMLAARHILLLTPQGSSDAQKDSVRKKADAVRAEIVKNGDFAGQAAKSSQDPGSKDKGGDLGLFPRGAMVKEFGDAVAALKPGEISQPVLTQFGYHIIRRSTFAEVQNGFTQALASQGTAAAESTYLAKIESNGNIQFKPGAAQNIRAAAKDLDAAQKSSNVIATSKAGDFTAKKLAQWIQAFPNNQQIRSGLQQTTTPDSTVLNFARTLIKNDLVLHQADSAKIVLTPAELSDVRSKFTAVVGQDWLMLGVSPSVLKDSAKSASERARFASTQVDRYLDTFLANPQGVQFVDVPSPLQSVLRGKYTWKVNSAGVDRAVERATKIRSSADSARAANRPASQVPMGPPIQLQGQPTDTGKKPAATKTAPKPATKKP
ncbi:MAG: peptidylprolyl isomerase [Gemmatimonadota bacterium]|nr:peptidylprolyl isomerase [Gemmatimonadota bacterium]